MKSQITVDSIFGNPKGNLRIQPVELVEKFLILRNLSVIPAIIEVITHGVGYMVHMTLRFHIMQIGAGSESRRIQLLRQFIEAFHCTVHILVFPKHGYLVLNPPEKDGWVVAVLKDQFCQLLPGIFQESRFLRHAEHGNLRPHHETVAVAHIIDIRSMLVMGQPDHVGSHLVNQPEIFLTFLTSHRVSHPFTVLVDPHSVKHKLFSV